MNGSQRVSEGLPKPLIREIAHTCTCTYTSNFTYTFNRTGNSTITGRRAAPCIHPNVNPIASRNSNGLRRGATAMCGIEPQHVRAKSVPRPRTSNEERA